MSIIFPPRSADKYSRLCVQSSRRQLSRLLQLSSSGRAAPRIPEPRRTAQLLQQRRRRLLEPAGDRLLSLGPRSNQRVRRGLRATAGQAAEVGSVRTLHKRRVGGQQEHGLWEPRAPHNECQSGGFCHWLWRFVARRGRRLHGRAHTTSAHGAADRVTSHTRATSRDYLQSNVYIATSWKFPFWFLLVNFRFPVIYVCVYMYRGILS